MREERFKVLDHIRELIVRVDKELDNFPKREIEIKTRLRNECFDLLEIGYLANVTTDIIRKESKIEEGIAKVKILDYLLNFSYDKQLISSKKYLKLAEKLNDITKYFNGWLKKVKEDKIKQ